MIFRKRGPTKVDQFESTTEMWLTVCITKRATMAYKKFPTLVHGSLKEFSEDVTALVDKAQSSVAQQQLALQRWMDRAGDTQCCCD